MHQKMLPSKFNLLCIKIDLTVFEKIFDVLIDSYIDCDGFAKKT